MLPTSERLHVFTDNTGSYIPPRYTVFVMAYFFNYLKDHNKLNVKYVLQIKSSEVDIIGDWICNVDYVFNTPLDGISYRDAFGYYLDGCRLSRHYAKRFVAQKYGGEDIIPNPTEEQLFVEFQKISPQQN